MRPDGTPDFQLAAVGRVTLAATDLEGGAAIDGRFECVASIFDQRVPRLFYDIVLRPGCFDRSLSERGLPSLVWSHDWQQPPIGVTERCEQRHDALEAAGRLFIDGDHPDPLALRVHRAMTERNGDGRATLREFSIGFDVIDAQWDIEDEEEVLAVTDGELYEFGPCLVGAVAGTGFLRGPDADELLNRFPRPSRDDRPDEEDRAAVRLARAMARTHVGREPADSPAAVCRRGSLIPSLSPGGTQ